MIHVINNERISKYRNNVIVAVNTVMNKVYIVYNYFRNMPIKLFHINYWYTTACRLYQGRKWLYTIRCFVYLVEKLVKNTETFKEQ